MRKENTEDFQHIQNILKGNVKSEIYLYDKYKVILRDFIFSKFPKRKEYEDDISEILIKVFINLSNFNPDISKFKTWVFTIAKNHIKDKIKCVRIETNDVYYTMSIDNSSCSNSLSAADLIGSNSCCCTSSVNNIELNIDNSTSITYLSEQLKSCDFSFLNMHYVYGYTYSEIGTEFNVSSNTVSNRVNYIKDKLRKQFDDEIIY